MDEQSAAAGHKEATYICRMTTPRSERPDMAGYGVTENPEGMLPWSWAEERLNGSRNFWLVTVNGSGRPHSMPVWGVWMPERQRWGGGFAGSARKVRNMRSNDQVVVTNDDSVNVVSIEGQAVPVAGDDAEPLIRAWVDKYQAELGDDLDATREFMHQSSMWEVVPERAFGLIESPAQFSTAATRWTWS